MSLTELVAGVRGANEANRGARVAAAGEGGGSVASRRDGCAKDVEVAEFFRVTPRTIWRWTREIPDFPKPFSIGTRYTAWQWADVYRFRDERTAAASAK